MSGPTLELQSMKNAGRPTGVVAYFRMPLSLRALEALDECIELAYGKGCVCGEDPQGWLKITTPEEEP